MNFNIEYDQQEDGRWLAEVTGLPGALACGDTSDEAIAKAELLALRVLADQLEQGGGLYAHISFTIVLKDKQKIDISKFSDLSHWNYRVIRKRHAALDSISYEVHEVYYRDDGGVELWTHSPVKPYGDALEELREDIGFFLQAFRRPVLEEQEVDGKKTLIEDDQECLINDGHYFEFMDRASVAADYVYQFLGSHPLIRKEKRLREIYLNAEQALAELYQEAGRLEFNRSRTDE